MCSHPSIITYLDSLDTESSLVLVTESIRPLSSYLSSIAPSSTTLLYGIYTLLLGLEFLHSKCTLSVSLSSPLAVVVDTNDVWKLNCFENTTPATATSIANDFKQLVVLLDTIPTASTSGEVSQLRSKISSVAKSIPTSTASSTATTILQSSCFYSDSFLPLKSIPTLHLLPPLTSISTLASLIPVAPNMTGGISASILPTLAKGLNTIASEYNNRDSREAVRQVIYDSCCFICSHALAVGCRQLRIAGSSRTICSKHVTISVRSPMRRFFSGCSCHCG